MKLNEMLEQVQIADIMGVSETRVVNMENGVALTPADYERNLNIKQA